MSARVPFRAEPWFYIDHKIEGLLQNEFATANRAGGSSQNTEKCLEPAFKSSFRAFLYALFFFGGAILQQFALCSLPSQGLRSLIPAAFALFLFPSRILFFIY